MEQSLGRHILVEFFGCDHKKIDDRKLIEILLTQAAKISGATVVGKLLHHFNPIGVSGVIVIAESHLAIHTWPEYGYVALDVFTCGEHTAPQLAVDFLQESFEAKDSRTMHLRRGFLHENGQDMQIESPRFMGSAIASPAPAPSF